MNSEIFYQWNLEDNTEYISEKILKNEELKTEIASKIEVESEIGDEVEDEVELDGEGESFSLDLDFYDEKDQEDMLWQARTGLNPNTLCGAIETIIFMSDKPISLQKIKGQIDEELPLRVLHESLEKLQNEYEQNHHGIRLVEVAEGYQFRTKATYSKFVQNLFKINSLVLTPSALEVLAIISYKQPISKNDIEKIRGVDSSHIVRALMDKRLVKIVGRSEDIGRPSLFGTSQEFLEVFNLKDISELPPEYELEEMAMKNTVGTIADIKSVVFRSETAKTFGVDHTDELNELSQSIREIKPETDFTLMLKSENKKKSSDDMPVVRKSAFDILEEYIAKKESSTQNELAAESETLLNVVEPEVIDPTDVETLFNTPVNRPGIGEDFEALREKEGETESIVDMKKNDGSQLKDDLHDDELEKLHQDSLELEKALDLAFENLTGENLSDFSSSRFEELHQFSSLENENEEGEKDEIFSENEDNDLDLSFLKEVSLDFKNESNLD